VVIDNLENTNLDVTEVDSFYDNVYQKWPFKEDDWLINKIFATPNFIHSILLIKNYKFNQISLLVY
jgi:hypothetical protein